MKIYSNKLVRSINGIKSTISNFALSNYKTYLSHKVNVQALNETSVFSNSINY
jgi:hypothetical protein